MVKQVPRLSREEFARRGHALYTRGIRRKLAGEKKGWFVAIDVETKDFAVADDTLTASELLLQRHPKEKI